MKNIIFQLLLVCLPALLAGQNYRWEVIHGVPTRNELALHVMEDYDKGLYVSGRSWIGYEGDAWSIKTDVNGNLLYDKKLKHEDYSLQTHYAVFDSDGNKYLCGMVQTKTAQWPYVSMLNVCGDLVWCKMLDEDGFSHGSASSLLINSNNELIVAVWYEGNPDFKIHLVAFDLSGNQLWKKPYASKHKYPLMDFPHIENILYFKGSYYMAGYCYYPFPNNPNHMWLRPLFIGIDSSFKEKFVIPFMVKDSVIGMAGSLFPVNDSIIMAVGARYTLPALYEIASSMMFIKTDGKELKYVDIPNDSIGLDVITSAAGEIEIINDSLLLMISSFGPDKTGNPIGEIITDTSGNVYKFHTESSFSSIAIALHKTYDDNFVLAGNKHQNNSLWYDIILRKINADLESVAFDTTQRVYDSLCPHTIQSSTLDLTACLTPVNVNELPPPDVYYESLRWIPVKAYPNPVTHGKLTLEFANTGHHQNMELRCFDNLGRMVHSQKVYKDQQDTELQVSAWAPGVYLAIVFSNGEARGKAKFIIQ
jgi:hypothetical protein